MEMGNVSKNQHLDQTVNIQRHGYLIRKYTVVDSFRTIHVCINKVIV